VQAELRAGAERGRGDRHVDEVAGPEALDVGLAGDGGVVEKCGGAAPGRGGGFGPRTVGGGGGGGGDPPPRFRGGGAVARVLDVADDLVGRDGAAGGADGGQGRHGHHGDDRGEHDHDDELHHRETAGRVCGDHGRHLLPHLAVGTEKPSAGGEAGGRG